MVGAGRCRLCQGNGYLVGQDNVLHRGCLHELIADEGEHREGVIVKDNPGCVFKPA
jgi:hypothetical protein